MTIEDELALVAEKHARENPGLKNSEIVVKLHQGECREIWVTKKTKYEGQMNKIKR